MIKVIEVKAPLETLNRIEATGLPTKWIPDKDVLEVIIDEGESDNDLLKLITALSESTSFTFKCVRMNGHTIEDIQTAIQEIQNRR